MSFFEIFNPGVRHWQAERDRQNMLVSKPTHGGGAPLGIDLDGGFAKITVTRTQPTTDPSKTESGEPAAAEVSPGAESTATSDSASEATSRAETLDKG